MGKTTRRIVAVLCVICLVVGSIAIPSFSCLKNDGSKTQAEMDKDVRYWRQGIVPDTGSELIYSGTDRTIRRAACSHFAMSYALVKMGYLNPAAGDTPMVHIQKARDNNSFRTSWGYFEYAHVSSMYPGVEWEGVDYNTKGLSTEQCLSYVKGLMDQGYYVIACVSTPDTGGHMIFFDGINEDGTTSIGDSWFECLTWEDYYGKTDTSISYIELLRCDSKPFDQQPSIYDDNALRGVTEEEVVTFEKLIQENSLTGMPVKSNLGQYTRIPTFPDRDGLLQHEKNALVSIKTGIEDRQFSMTRFIGAVSSFIGIVLIMYAVLLLLAFVFDKVNNFIDLKLVTLFTFGVVHIYADAEDAKSPKKGFITDKGLFMRIGIIAAVGITFVSGVVIKFVYLIAGWLS